MSKTLLEKLERFGERPGLERIQFLLNALGNPERAFPAVHVAGTNGKGSTSAMIASVLRAAGLRVGLFTSPHLVRYNERIVVDGRCISDEELDALMGELEPLLRMAAAAPGVGQPTEFEAATAAAVAYFARRRVDVAVVEVGLGGSLDSTNVVRPVVSVMTPIGLDHTNRLGKTLAQIARDKAGIIRPGVPVVSAAQAPEAAQVIAEAAAARGAPLLMAGRDFDVRLRGVGPDGTEFDVKVPVTDGEAAGAGGHAAKAAERWMKGLRVPLLGAHQAGNGAVAAVACLVLREAGGAPGPVGAYPAPHPGPDPVPRPAAQQAVPLGKWAGITEAAVREGLRNVRWPGRMEVLPGRPAVILDGAHNAEAAAVLAEALRAVFPSRRPVFVFAALREKPVDRMLEQLLPLGRAVVLTAPRSSRTPPMDPHELARRAADRIEAVFVEPAAERAVEKAKALAGPEGVVCVCGSLYLVGEVRGLLAGEGSFERE